MALEWLERIKAAEASADRLRADATAQGHDIVKSVKDASLVNERHAAVELRGEYQARMAQKRDDTERAILAESGAKEALRDTMCKAAQARIPDAARIVVERILRHGDR